MLNVDTPLKLKLATSRYQERDLIIASGLAPVRITLGAPKFDLGYELAGEIPELAPSRRIFGLPWEHFEPAYLEQLEHVDWPDIERRLGAIVASRGAPGGVMLCFENVLAGEHCHRRLVAEWIEDQTGLVVPELSRADESPGQAGQLALV
jgi:hypothetical protein